MNETDSDSSSDDEGLLTELDHYLKSARVKDVKDPLQWWIMNRASYPRLSRMAIDFPVIPGKCFYYYTFNYLLTILLSLDLQLPP